MMARGAAIGPRAELSGGVSIWSGANPNVVTGKQASINFKANNISGGTFVVPVAAKHFPNNDSPPCVERLCIRGPHFSRC